MKRISAVLVLAGALAAPSGAYELRTHAWMSFKALEKSVLNGALPINLGLYGNPVLGPTFLDIASPTDMRWARTCPAVDPTPKGLLIFNFPTSP